MNSMENGKSTSSSKSSANSAAHAGHRERLRGRAAVEGVETFKPHELLELLLFYAIPRRNVNALAHTLNERFGGVGGVLTAGEAELAAVPGVGARTAAFLRGVGELCAAYAELCAGDRPILGNLRRFRDFVCRHRRAVEGEETWQFCLTYEGRLLLAHPIAPGVDWAEPEYLRGALDDVIASHAHSVLLAQYVEAPRPTPAEGERERTCAYGEALSRLDVQLLDHLLVGSEDVYSMRAEGDLKDLNLVRAGTSIGERYMGPPPTPRARLREEDAEV